MEISKKASSSARIERELAHLKIISRLLGHEMHAQTGQRILLSRESVQEIQTSIDLFIEAAGSNRNKAAAVQGVEPTPVASRNN
jgi:hypothetical protein